MSSIGVKNSTQECLTQTRSQCVLRHRGERLSLCSRCPCRSLAETGSNRCDFSTQINNEQSYNIYYLKSINDIDINNTYIACLRFTIKSSEDTFNVSLQDTYNSIISFRIKLYFLAILDRRNGGEGRARLLQRVSRLTRLLGLLPGVK